MSLSNSMWFFCILLTSLTGSVAYGILKEMEYFLRKRQDYDWLIVSAKLVTVFWIVPLVFLYVLKNAYDGEAWTNDAFGISPLLFRTLRVFFYCWIIGFLWQIAVYLYQKYNLYRMKRYNILPDSQMLSMVERTKKEYHIRKKIKVYKNMICKIPQVSGIFVSTILIPSDLEDTRALEIIIGHELMHVKHGDLGWKYFLSWVKRIHWFNPVVNLVIRDIEEWNEIYCDIDMCRKENSPFAFKEYFETY